MMEAPRRVETGRPLPAQFAPWPAPIRPRRGRGSVRSSWGWRVAGSLGSSRRSGRPLLRFLCRTPPGQRGRPGRTRALGQLRGQRPDPGRRLERGPASRSGSAIPAPACDYAARPGSCRKPPGAL